MFSGVHKSYLHKMCEETTLDLYLHNVKISELFCEIKISKGKIKSRDK
jgi:hypothetical protein